jgi:hypothetical protein
VILDVAPRELLWRPNSRIRFGASWPLDLAGRRARRLAAP